jgi:hypothetical protein
MKAGSSGGRTTIVNKNMTDRQTNATHAIRRSVKAEAID